MNFLFYFLLLAAFFEKIWKLFQVFQFFRKPQPEPNTITQSISILQPILSGDPTLSTCLEDNLKFRTAYPHRFIWLLDQDDQEANEICQNLKTKFPQKEIDILLLPPPEINQNPKVVKLITGLAASNSDCICVLDDDTSLPDYCFEQSIPYLEMPRTGLVFGLPYYRSFTNIWSTLVAAFVNSHSLLTYLPYLKFTDPLTINGMFYCLKRETLLKMGGFSDLEHILADDFAINQRVRSSGLVSCQTPVLHPISTTVKNARHYASLIQRWFIFPRESLMRHLSLSEKTLLYGFALFPMFFIWALITLYAIQPSTEGFIGIISYIVLNDVIFIWLNHKYLQNITPFFASMVVPLLQLILPFQLLLALLSPPQISWRGHIIKSTKGGGLKFIRRRSMD